MYLRPALRAFSESASPPHRPPYTLCFSAISLRNCRPDESPRGQPRLPAFVIETGEIYHTLITRSIKPWSRSRKAFLSPSVLPSSFFRARPLSSSFTSAGKMQSSESAVAPVPKEESSSSVPELSPEDVIVQYIVIRKDLVVGLNWPLGSVISQGCHAAVAAVWLHKEDPVTQQYCAPESLDKMHKVTLEVKGEAQLRTLAQKLESGGIVHKLWIEQPENYATCLATKPYPKSEVASYFKKLKLCK